MGTSFEELVRIVGEYPSHVEFRMGTEINKEDGERFFYVSIEEKAPEDGWASAGAYFRAMKGAIHWKQKCHPADLGSNGSRVSVTARDAETCARLAVEMIRKALHRFDNYPPTEEDAPTLEEMMTGGR